ncbi:NinB protein [Vibrio phage 1.168.O._10N.261.52.A10]|nr:NinB protein [Vibrio phage 1.116.O._10N.222.52.C10]AUR92012.1 NinB protein [Vibrio phage 1.168.O._10N.261.52.A10]AUR92464.1 NinB protein [Vibrio phage 1.172.O._10N.261.52.F5]
MNDYKLNSETILGFMGLVNTLDLDQKSYRIKITEWRDKRSLSQNNLYWMWLNEISNQIEQRLKQCHDAETLHEYMKMQFCPQQEVAIGSNKASVKFRSTSKLQVGEMHHYLTKIEQWAIERGFKLTVPIDSQYAELAREQER